MKKPVLKDGDIVLIKGELIQVIDVDYPDNGTSSFVTLEDDELRVCSTSYLKDCKNLGSDPSLVASFLMTKSIHLRLNRLGTV